jgi:Protein of unknown function (DUF2844)
VKFLTVLIAVLAMPACYASLGGPDSTIDSDAKALQAKHTNSNAPSYAVHTLSLPGTQVIEYVNKSNNVFAITWQGVTVPNLSVLLGSNFSKYQQALGQQPQRHGRRFVTIKNSDLIVYSGGHMRDYHGRAIVPDLVPAGVNAETLP